MHAHSRLAGAQSLGRSVAGLFFALDGAVFLLAMALAFSLRFGFGYNWFPNTGPRLGVYEFITQCTVGYGVFFYLCYLQGMYEPESLFRLNKAIRLVLRTGFIWGVVALGVTLLLKINTSMTRLFWAMNVFSLVAILSCSRIATYILFPRSLLCRRLQKRVALVGCSQDSDAFADRVNSCPESCCHVVGIIGHEEGEEGGGGACHSPYLGSVDDLESIIGEHELDAVMIADLGLSQTALAKVFKVCERHFTDFQILPGMFKIFTSCLRVQNIGGQPVLGFSEMPQNRLASRLYKRTCDFIGACVGFLAALPLCSVLIPLMLFESPGPIIYKQVRVGLRGRRFVLYKLRSMRVDAEVAGKVGWTTKDDPRCTRVGRFMRKWNLDETPQFWNVLRGDMSLVGPRPERPELIESFQYQIPYYQSRHAVKPGLTGWAQVSGLRGDTSIEKRIRYDLHYIENWSPWLDFMILVKTLFCYKGSG